MDKKWLDKDDNELVKLSLETSENFLYLMRRYERQLLVYIKRISGLNSEDTEDVLQEVFIKIYYNLNGYNSKLKFSSWVYRIAHNTTISEMRKRKVRPVNYMADEDLVRIIDSLKIVDLDNDLKLEIREVLNKMEVKYREILILKFLEEKDYNEISDILKKPIGTVGTLINRAKKQFKKIYEEEEKYGKHK